MDLITYCPAIDTMRLTIAANPSTTFYIDEESDAIKMLGGCHIPVKYNGNETLCVVRGHEGTVLEAFGLQILGHVSNGDYIFNDQASQDTYERVRDQQTFTDEDGKEYIEHYKIGLIA